MGASSADFRAAFDVNLVAMFNLSQLMGSNPPQTGGRIINLSTRLVCGGLNVLSYSSTKAAVIGLTRSLALEFAPLNITVNAIAPGAVRTRMVMTRPDTNVDQLLSRQPIKRIGEPSEVADAIAYFASKQAGYITGQTLFIDGGRSIGGFGV